MSEQIFDIENEINIFLEEHTVLELYDLIENVIARRAYRLTDVWVKNCLGFLNVYKKLPEGFYDESQFPETGIYEMEQGCKAIKNMAGQTELNHLQRTALLMCYAQFGDPGIKRLHQILSYTKKYSYTTTQYQIDAYLKKNKRYGITCNKMRKWGLCSYASCQKAK